MAYDLYEKYKDLFFIDNFIFIKGQVNSYKDKNNKINNYILITQISDSIGELNTSMPHKFIIKWKSLQIQMLYQKKWNSILQKNSKYEDEILFKSAFEVLYFCGLRLGELGGLTWDNINFEEMTLSVKKNVVTVDSKVYVTTPKSKKSVRTIPLTQTLADDLKILKNNCKKYFGFNNKWYVFGDIKHITQERMRIRKNLLASKSGVKPIRLHDFRHSCASLLINNGANIMIVAKYLGHTKIDETLNTYSHLFKNKMEDIVKIMNTLY